MEKFYVWISVVIAVSVALAANTISAIWAAQPEKYTSWWFAALIVISPFVFVTFGLTVNKLGVAIGAGTIDSVLSICTVLVGLFIFKEINTLSFTQYCGLGLTLVGVVLLHVKS